MTTPFAVDRALTLTPESAAWRATIKRGALFAPMSLELADGTALCQTTAETFNGLPLAGAVVRTWRDRREAGCAVVESEGYFPFGTELHLDERGTWNGNLLRQRLDLLWRAGAIVREPLSWGSLELPGVWTKFLRIPQQGEAAWQSLPAAESLTAGTVLFDDSEAPLAVVLERADGARLEIATGSDLWRWNQALGGNRGRHQLLVGANGLRYHRQFALPAESADEPFTPASRKYRLTAHLAWEAAPPSAHSATPAPITVTANSALGASYAESAAPLLLDLRHFHDWPSHWCKPDSLPCWEDAGVQRHARAFIRRLAAARPEGGTLLLDGFTPGWCTNASHMERSNQKELAHWDINGLLDFALWAARQLGAAWTLQAAALPFPWCELPSLRHPFTPGSFAPRD